MKNELIYAYLISYFSDLKYVSFAIQKNEIKYVFIFYVRKSLFFLFYFFNLNMK